MLFKNVLYYLYLGTPNLKLQFKFQICKTSLDHVVQCTYTETSNSQRTLHGILSLLLVKDLLSADPKKATKVCNETYHDCNKKFMPDEIVILLEV